MVLIILTLLTPQAHADCLQMRAATLPLKLWQDKIFVTATLNGQPADFIIDTGAARTTLNASLAAAQEIPRNYNHTADMFGVGGAESHVYLGIVKNLTLDTVSFENQELPLAAFAQKMADLKTPVGGLIGADILSQFDVEIDIPHRTLSLWNIRGCTSIKPTWATRPGTPVTIAPSRHIYIPVAIDHVSMNLLLDTGAPNLVLTTRAAGRAGVTSDILDESRTIQETGVNNRSVNAWFHIFPRLEVAGHIFGDARTIIVPTSKFQNYDGLLGLEYLKRTHLYISYSTAQIFLEP